MNAKPNALQRLAHQFIMLCPVTAFFANKVHVVDKLILKLTGGKYTVSGLAGWTMIQLTATGAKTGQECMSPLVGLLNEEKIAIVASSFGRVYNPNWYYNLKAHPECKVEWKIRDVYWARDKWGGV